MKKIVLAFLVSVLFMWPPSFVSAAEHGGSVIKEHGGTTTAKAPSAYDIHEAMKSYITDKSKETGTLDIEDFETGKVRHLTLQKIHDRVGKTGNYYYSCADFKDVNSGEMLDLDLDVNDMSGKLSVVDVRIHKVNGKERYTYDKNDNRVPVPK